MAQSITLERVARRVYLVGLPFGLKDQAKSELGASWDGDRRQWWVGSGKLAAAEAFVVGLSGPVMVATPASERAAAAVGLDAGTPAGIVADKLEDAGRTAAAAAVRQSETAEQIAAMRVYAKVTYQGRTYYVVAETRDQTRCRLTTLDGMSPFWADMAACTLVRRYEGREAWDGRRYSGRTVTKYDTIGSLRRFRDQQRREAAAGIPACAACGKRGELVHDLEDGLSKCLHCCDIPE